MADIELIVKIPEEVYKQIKDSSTIFRDDEKMCYEAVQNGTPLAKHDEEIIKETVESIWGKPPCDDAISREAVINTIMPYCSDDDGSTGNLDDLRNVLDDIESLPPVQPKRDKGDKE